MNTSPTKKRRRPRPACEAVSQVRDGEDDLGPGKKGFQRLATQSCTVSIVAHATKPNPALSDWVIEHWRWQGVC